MADAKREKEALPTNDTATAPRPAAVDPDAALSSILLVQHEGDAGKLLEGVFEFLRRRTNFFRQENARERALAALDAVAARAAAAPAGDLTPEQVAAAAAASAAGGAAGGAAAASAAEPNAKEEEEAAVARGKEKEEQQQQSEPAGGSSSGDDGGGEPAAPVSGGLMSESCRRRPH